ncbi:MAG: hypothetical protein ACRDVN_05865 [Jiangellaceae bacterium]
MCGFRTSRLRALPRATRFLLGRMAGPRSRRTRRAAELLLMRAPALVGRAESGGVYFVVSTILRRDDPRTEAILACARAFADAAVPVHVLVLEFARDADHEVAQLMRGASLPRSATVRYFWRHAAPSGDGGFATAALRDLPVTARGVLTPGHPERTSYFVDGLPVATVTQLQHGLEVEHLGPDAAPIRRDDYDERRRLVRMLDLRPDTGQAAMRRYLDADGTCWLSAWVNPSSGRSGPVQVYSPTPMEFAGYRDVWARWVTRELHRSASALVISDDAVSGRVVARSRHPAAHKVAVGPEPRPVHSAELLAFYQHVITPAWRPRRSGVSSPPAPLHHP